MQNKVKISDLENAFANYPKASSAYQRIVSRFVHQKDDSIFYDEKMSKVMKSFVIGAKVRVFAIKSDDIDIYTYPFSGIKKVKISPALFFLYFIPNLKLAFKILNSKAQIVDNKIKFTNVNTIDVYYTLGAKQLLSERELTASLLHEIGHSTTQTIFALEMLSSAVYKIAGITTIIALIGCEEFLLVILVILGLLLNNMLSGLHTLVFKRKEEYASDKIAGELGFGADIVSALQKFRKYDNELYHDIVSNTDDRLYAFNLRIKYLIYKIKEMLKLSEHPSLKDRSLNLVTENFITDYIDTFLSNILMRVSDYAL